MSELEAAWLRLQLPHLARRQPPTRATSPAATAPRAPRAALARRPRRPRRPPVRRPRRRSRRASAPALAERGVATGVHYPLALTQQPAYRRFATSPCPEAEAWAAECVSLPCFPELTDDEVEQVAGGPGAPRRRDAAQPRGHGDLGVLPLLQRRAGDPDDGARRPPGARRERRRLRDHRRRRRVDATTRSTVLTELAGEIPELRIVEHPTQPRLRRGAAVGLRRGDAGVGLLHRRRRPVRRLRADALHRRRAARTSTSCRATSSAAATRGTAG